MNVGNVAEEVCVFDRYLVRISARTPDILSEFFANFLSLPTKLPDKNYDKPNYFYLLTDIIFFFGLCP
jgi:hypothetical protein